MIVTESCPFLPDDGLKVSLSKQTARLTNSETLKSFPSSLQHLSAEQQRDILELVDRFPCLFADVPTRTSILQHDIVVSHAKPIKQHAYRINPVKRTQMKQETDYLQEHGFALRSSSPWSSKACWRPNLTECRGSSLIKVNAVTVLDSYPLPRMEDCVDNLGLVCLQRQSTNSCMTVYE